MNLVDPIPITFRSTKRRVIAGEVSLLGRPGTEVRINSERINGLFHLLFIWDIPWGDISHWNPITFDPNASCHGTSGHSASSGWIFCMLGLIPQKGANYLEGMVKNHTKDPWEKPWDMGFSATWGGEGTCPTKFKLILLMEKIQTPT